MRYLILAMVCFPLCAGDATQGQSKQPSRVSQLMADKLKHAKTVLEGLALGDFAKISRSAEELVQLSKTAEWMVLRTPKYEMYSNEFRRAADSTIQKARAKNLDGATLAYFEMTMSCVRCHQYVREVRDARLPGERPDLALLRAAVPRSSQP